MPTAKNDAPERVNEIRGRAPTWAAVLALVASAGAVACGADSTGTSDGSSGSSSSSSGSSGTVYPPGHPCEDAGSCSQYIELPDDGGAVAAPADGGDLGGQIRMCGPCNG